MNLASDMYKDVSHARFDFIDPDWLAGAVTGMQISGKRSPSWLWDPFLEDIEYMCDMLGGIGPICIESMNGVISIYDTLGGYVSVTGTLAPEGLWFRVTPEAQIEIRHWLSGIELVCSGNDLLVPLISFETFLRLVPIRGPIEDHLVQEGYI